MDEAIKDFIAFRNNLKEQILNNKKLNQNEREELKRDYKDLLYIPQTRTELDKEMTNIRWLTKKNTHTLSKDQEFMAQRLFFLDTLKTQGKQFLKDSNMLPKTVEEHLKFAKYLMELQNRSRMLGLQKSRSVPNFKHYNREV